ncbi:MAG: hypothetical protein QM778_32780 [Myxococcales bacterium]
MLESGDWVTLGQPMPATDMAPVQPTQQRPAPRGPRSWQRISCGVLTAWSIAQSAGAEEPKAQSEPEMELVVEAVEKKPTSASEQEDPTESMDYLALADAPVFLPRSYLYWGSPVGPKGDRQPLIFALEYALHLPFYNDLRDKALLGKNWSGAATLSFEGDLRMLAEESKPVRMPSYRPTISGQLFYIWHRPAPALFGFRTGLFHYSNGQERCTFDVALGDDTKACRAITAQVTDPSRALNRVSGNFATNGFLLEANARVHRLNARGVAVAHAAAGFGVAGNFRAGAWGLDPGLRRFYGWGRVRATLEARTLWGRSSITLRTALAGFPDTGPRVPKLSGELEAVLAPYWLTGFGLFARYYGGRDFYNAFFVDSIQQFAAGLSWDGERPLTFRPSELPAQKNAPKKPQG